MRITALVLAAGRSARMGALNKLTAPLMDKPLICHAVDALLESSVPDVLVVTGHDEAAVRSALGERAIRFVSNPAAESGMSSSISAGIAALIDAELDGVVICLADMPAISPLVVDALVKAFESRSSIVVPVRENRRGHPVLFGADHFEALHGLRGDGGARRLLDRERGHVIEVQSGDRGIHLDIDTPEDLDVARNARPVSR